jgi:carboxymethylenebutenolidase
MTQIEIQTRDGQCPTYVFRPTGTGPFPAVLVYMDGIGIRPAMLAIGERIAQNGYYVLLPDLFYRSGPYAPMDARNVFTDPELRKVLMEKFFKHASPAKFMSDTQALLDYLAAQAEVQPGPIGVTGYCMGGLMALTAAGTYPERIAAAASFHGARLATDAPDSPHLLAPKMRARIYVAGAIEDPTFPDDQKQRLKDALDQAGVANTVETYPAKHGWVLTDTAAYDEPCAERHWQALLSLFDQTLKAR